MTRLYEKRFLNSDGFHSIGAIGYNVSTSDYGSLDGEIQISDCSRTVFIDLSDSFGMFTNDYDEDNKAERENNLRKIDTMINVLQNCKKDFITLSAECDIVAEESKAKKEVENNKKKSIFNKLKWW